MAYLILAHENPRQLELLIERLLADNDDIAIIHADRRSALYAQLRKALPGPAGRVQLVEHPVAVRWGHWSQVAAEALLVREAVQSGCDAAHLISGVDWPVVPRETLVAGMRAGECRIEVREGHMEARMQTFRLDDRWLRIDPVRQRRTYALTWELRRLSRWGDALRARLGRERSRPFGPWVYGTQRWSLPRDALAYLDQHLSALLASGRLRGTVCADEHIVPTLIAHRFAGRIAPNLRYADFPAGSSSPRTLDASDRAAILASGAWFIRKVDHAHDWFFLTLP
ncbi:beta-1,6-N-acetylglucosaminyltransferase [Novosphingobium sp. 9]|uniref:beta-1,6-N-acetylglucosaminyltransferase n=1 Tax=Novosphingobium sp. 9 TaxID=2025349 RepID=UPI0021B5CF13|nr:beta-1,6-N-acetylglucosaminyltransferase [Novosphingobium sp. 9]